MTGDGPSGLLAVIDPVDGSTNAHRGVPFYSTSICVLDAEGPRVGLVVNQATGERYAAVRGGGAEKDGRAIAPSGCEDLGARHRGDLGLSRAVTRAGRSTGPSARPRSSAAPWPRACSTPTWWSGRSTLYGWDYLAGLLDLPRGGRGRGRARGQGPGRARRVEPAARRGGDARAGRPAGRGGGPVTDDDGGGRRGRAAGAQDVADPGAAARHGLLRARGRGGVRATRHHRAGGLLRVAGGADGRGDGRRRRLDLLQLQPGAGARGDPRGLGGRRRRWRSWRRASPRSTRPSGGSWATTVRGVGRDAPRRRAGPRRRPRRRRGGWRDGRWRRPTPTWRGRPSRTWCCGTPSRSCASTAATATSRSSSCTACRARGAGHPRGGRRRAGAPAALDAGLARRRPGTARSTRCGGGAGSSRATSSASPSGARRSAGAIEDGTDALAAAPYDVLGEARLRRAAGPGPAVEHDLRGAPALTPAPDARTAALMVRRTLIGSSPPGRPVGARREPQPAKTTVGARPGGDAARVP